MAQTVNFSKCRMGKFVKNQDNMNLKKTILAIIALFFISNVLTSIWYMLMDDANHVPFRRETINYAGLMANHLIYASIFVILFPSFYEKSSKMFNAFLFGALMGTVMFLPSGMVVRSIWQVDFDQIFILNSIAHIVIGGIMGIIMALIYNFKNKKNESI